MIHTVAAKVWAQNYCPRKILNSTSMVIRRHLDKDPTLTARKHKENNPGLLHDVFLII